MPGWCALLATHWVPLPTPRPSLLAPVPAHRDWGEKGRAGGVRCQSRIVVVYRAPPRHKTGAARNRRHHAKQVPAVRPRLRRDKLEDGQPHTTVLVSDPRSCNCIQTTLSFPPSSIDHRKEQWDGYCPAQRDGLTLRTFYRPPLRACRTLPTGS